LVLDGGERRKSGKRWPVAVPRGTAAAWPLRRGTFTGPFGQPTDTCPVLPESGVPPSLLSRLIISACKLPASTFRRCTSQVPSHTAVVARLISSALTTLDWKSSFRINRTAAHGHEESKTSVSQSPPVLRPRCGRRLGCGRPAGHLRQHPEPMHDHRNVVIVSNPAAESHLQKIPTAANLFLARGGRQPCALHRQPPLNATYKKTLQMVIIQL
jgi:hypothetical protein